MNAVKTNLKRLRLARTMTQDELAEKLHVVRQTVSSWETGKTTPDVETLTAIAEALEVDITELIYGTRPVDTISAQRNVQMHTAVCWAVAAMVCGVLSGCWKAVLQSVGITSAFAPGSFVVDPVRWGLIWFGAAFLPSVSCILAGIAAIWVVRIRKPVFVANLWIRAVFVVVGVSIPLYYFSIAAVACLQFMSILSSAEIIQEHFFFFYRNQYVFFPSGLFLGLGLSRKAT